MLVRKKLTAERIHHDAMVPPSVRIGGERLDTDVLAVGEVRPFRASTCGSSVAHIRVGAGTQGAIVKLNDDGDNHLCILSNNHVQKRADSMQSDLEKGIKAYLEAMKAKPPGE